jgi:NitT/TauT family transport system permease protein
MTDPQVISPHIRPEFQRSTLDAANVGEIERPLSSWERLTNIAALRRVAILVGLALLWQVYAIQIENPLMLPKFSSAVLAFFDAIANGDLPLRVWTSIKILLMGYASGVGIAAVLTALAVSTRFGNDLLGTLTAMFNPLPAIALLPLAMLWFGLGTGSLVFVLIHSVLWSVALNTHSGFLAVSDTLRMVGQNYGLTGIPYVIQILMPAAFPSILAGLKIGWAFAWRTLIAAELVFGVSSGSGGLGWFIFMNKMELEIAYVFAGLGTVIIIGLLVEVIVFRTLENHTVRKWGMQH